ncbi:MAG: hypothetical protein MR428_03480 [Mesosutterella sp.]|uniref:BPSS1780 family membrane protein n=1 Tax=Mesosutterella faecium TaxID=2925194 RepID=A0ABT7IM31_9BURK|nr:BPSS1780 family membrane protein [Mesosutterella sp. AGMB02718]MCI6530141.1 hypothetical protein [Mesosutterella sp.]MDL2059419.1 BPSS1780 family membrane protein [Mesosutterella sp. AGMB02718]
MGVVSQIKNGLSWFSSSLRILRLQPLGFTAVASVYVMTMALFGMLPWVGLVFAGLFWPFGTLLIAKGGADSLSGRRPTLEILFQSWHRTDTRLRMLRVGILYAMMIVLVSIIWEFLAADDIAKWEISAEGRINWDSAAQHVPYGAIVAALAVYIPCAMALWFAPLLIYLKNLPLPKALFFSFFGCLSNLPAIAVALFLAFGATGLLMGLTALFVSVSGLGAVALFFLFPVSFLCTALIYGTYYPMWKTVFSEVTFEGPRSERPAGF